MTPEPSPPDASEASLHVHPESLRVVTYLAFWIMVGCAVLFHTYLVKDEDIHPFDGANIGADPSREERMAATPLVEQFGYNNICIYWDYTPSRELTAMIYPIVEYPLVAYLILTFLQIRASYRSGELPLWFLRFSICCFVVKLILVAWFRMIFVVIAFKNVIGHTLGFQGLQLALIVICLENFIGGFLWGKATGKWWKLPYLTVTQTTVVAGLYVALLVTVTIIKLTLVISIFANNPVVDSTTDSGAAFSHAMDRMWLLLAAVCPLFIALHLRRTEPSIEITIRKLPPISGELCVPMACCRK